MTQLTKRTQWLLAAALAALPALYAGTAHAQSQLNQNGRVLDANPRIGSGGVNTFRAPPTAGTFGNDIVYGNVTQGRAFHGNAESDPTRFRGFTPGTSTDNFVRDSSQVGVPYSPQAAPNQPSVFYPESRFAPAPAGTVPAPFGGGYIPAAPIVTPANDPRLGARPDAAPIGVIPRPGELLLPGPVDPTSNLQTVLSASPLTGVRQWNPGDMNDISYLNQYTGIRQDAALEKLSRNDVLKMQQELRQPMGAIPNSALPNGIGSNAALGSTGSNGLTPQQGIGRPMAQPMETPANPAISGRPIGSPVQSNTLNSNVGTDQSYVNRVLGAPETQSTQYDSLKKRLERYNLDRKSTGQAATDAFNEAMKKKQAADAKLASGVKNPNLNTLPIPTKETTPKPAPLPIKSISSGVQGKGLKDILTKAETLMRDGKYTSAIDEYAAADQVAPNQPLIWIGRANAELGASYYSRAEAHLKQAFAADQALLMAQYDLRAFLGEERLQSIVKDLKEIASNDQQSPTPVFLLGYISYNTGHERSAAAYLDLAEKRSGGKDPIFKLLREHWTLPDLNDTTPEKAPESDK